MRARRFKAAVAVAIGLVFGGCQTTPPYVYHYVPGQTATLAAGYAAAPPAAPPLVRRAIAAGNEIAGLPYRFGGGHANFYEGAYDCSGAVSYVLHSIGRLSHPEPSASLRHYGESGPGRWVTVYAREGHAFLVVAGLRFDTGYGAGARGPHWLTRSRPADGYVMRHPSGL
ncbi:MAG TPA: peptidoglycan endopeptidase [Chthoniobacterales bacterium]